MSTPRTPRPKDPQAPTRPAGQIQEETRLSPLGTESEAGSDSTILSSAGRRTPSQTLVGQRWDDFELLEELGRGGMGAVYRARQISLDRIVALKVMLLSTDAEFRQRFQREARALAQLDSPHVVKVFYCGEHEAQPYFVMEFLVGADMSQRFKDGWLPNQQEAVDLVLQAARGLEAAARRGIIHRDIKPANLHITRDGVLKLMDFGLVRMAEDQELTNTGTVLGTVQYFSPEQGRGGRCDHRSDIYSLGVVFFRLLTGRLPFSAESTVSLIYQHVHVAPPSPRLLNPDIPEALSDLVLRCLDKNPAKRFQSAGELAQALEVVPRGPGAVPPPRPNHRRRGVVAAMLGMGLIVGLGLAWLHVRASPQVGSPAALVATLPGAPVRAAHAEVLSGAPAAPAVPQSPSVATPSGRPRSGSPPAPAQAPIPMDQAIVVARPDHPAAAVVPSLRTVPSAPPIPAPGVGPVASTPAPPATSATPVHPLAAAHGDPLPVPGLSVPVHDLLGWSSVLTVGGLHESFRWIAQGSFVMGSPTYEQDRHSDEVQHPVEISSGFWLEENPCSQALWTEVMGANPSRPQGAVLPANRLSRNDCHAFLSRLGARLPHLRARLPWEAEWEYACRAGTDTPYPWKGDLTPAEACFDSSAPRAVGQGAPNAWGLRDMLGTVVEWCEDDYQDYPSVPVRDPHPTGDHGVGRGGCWKDAPNDCRSARRFHAWIDHPAASMGMRIALDGRSD